MVIQIFNLNHLSEQSTDTMDTIEFTLEQAGSLSDSNSIHFRV